MRLIDAETIEKYIENGLNCKDPQNRFGHDAVEILTEVHYAPTITPLPNDPLTLEELREMDGEPVWVEKFKRWMFVSVWGQAVTFVDSDNLCYSIRMTGQVYRRRPEEEPHHE